MYLDSVKKILFVETGQLVGVVKHTRIMNAIDIKNIYEMDNSWFCLLSNDDLAQVKNALYVILNSYINKPFTITNEFIIEKIIKQLNTLK